MIATKPWLVLWLGVLCGNAVAQAAADEAPLPPAADIPVALLESPPAAGDGATEQPLAWLDRIAAASQRLNYVGTFSYQTGRRFETSRIAHRYADGVESERLEVLDGSPREVVRQGGEIRCLLPAQRTVIVSRAGARGSFPGRLLQGHPGLSGSYDVRLGDIGRIAGHEAQKVVLKPHDELRFGHVLWAETQSGLLLKSQVLDVGGAVVEQFAFSDVRIGGDINDSLLAAQASPQADWRVIDMGSDDAGQREYRWPSRDPLPGFALVSKVNHRGGGAVQMVFSDGLAAISVFIEPAEAGAAPRGGFPAGGAVNAFERIAGGQRITVLGEVPARAAQQAAETIDMGRK